MNKRDKKLIVIIIALVLMLVVVLVGVFVYLGKEEGKDENRITIDEIGNVQEEDVSEQETVVIPTIDLSDGFEINTSCGTIYYPAEWKEYLKMEQNLDGYEEIKFYANIEGKEKHIFDIILGSEKGEFVGNAIASGGRKIAVSFVEYDLEFSEEWSEEEKRIAEEMKEEMYGILGQFTFASEDEEISETTIPQNTDEVVIETPYGNLYYSGTWNDYLVTETEEDEDYRVGFFADFGDKKIHVFDIFFGESGESAIGTAEKDGKTFTVTMTIYETDEENLSSEKNSVIIGMKEDVNYIIQKLVE